MHSGGEYAYQREKLLGILQYFSQQLGCHLHYDETLSPFLRLPDLVGWDGDGIITEVYSEEEEDLIRSLGVTFVNTSSHYSKSPMHTICPDNRQIGRVAAQHLLKFNLDHFAFAGPPSLTPAFARYEGFAQHLKSRGVTCDRTLMDNISSAESQSGGMADAVPPQIFLEPLLKMKRPIGIFASSDRVGISILLACRQLGLRLPDDVALIGVDNDEIFSQLSYVGMTSIQPNSARIGYEAAKLLKRLMDGESIEPQRIEIPPEGIVQRDSTDAIRSKYREVAHALRYIRNHAHEDIDVNSLVDVLPVSRRSLETKFKEEVGRGISQEIRRVRVERAKELLLSSDQSLDQIARNCGFSSVARLNFAFQRLLGMNASDFRNAQPAP